MALKCHIDIYILSFMSPWGDAAISRDTYTCIHIQEIKVFFEARLKTPVF